MISRSACLIFIAIVPGALIAADEPKPVLKLVSSTVQVIPSAGDTATADLFVQAENFPKNSLGKDHPTVQDLPVLPTPQVRVATPEFQRVLSLGETGAIWCYRLTVAGLPKQSSIARKMSLALGDRQFTVDYTLTDKPPAAFSWSFLAPPVWNLVDSSSAEIPIVVKEVQATGIRLLQSTLTRQGARAVSLGTQNLELCWNREGKCQSPDAVGPSDSRVLFLHLNNAGNGTYSGNIVIRCDQKPEGDIVAVTANVTSTSAQWKGAGAVAVGVLAYFLVVVVARWQLAKKSRQELALLLLEQVEEVKKHAAHAVAAAPDWARGKTRKAFEDLENLLSDTDLHPFMPGPLNPDAKMDEFKAHLRSAGLRLDSLNIVVELGISEIAQAWADAAADPVKEAAVTSAVDGLLAIPDGRITAADTKTKVTEVLNAMNNAIGRKLAAGLGVQDVQLRLQHVLIASAGWIWLVLLVWVGVTLITGVMAMVLSKAGFGTPSDYLLCLLWGFGLPVAGTQLNQLTATGIGPKLGITLPKAEA